jgi:hypothetical protein
MCTRAVSGLAYFLEAEGIATVVLGLIPHHVRKMRPPRALLVPFELGRPLGAPHDPELQHEVLSAALGLLDQAGPGPIVASFEASFEAKSGAISADQEAWVCPVSFPVAATGSSLAERVGAEVRLLQPWFNLAYRQRGHTAADVSGMDMDTLVGWLSEFLDDPGPRVSPVAQASLSESFKLGLEDLKAFYLEAITVQPHSGSSSDLNTWFWEETAAGELLWSLRERLWEHPDDGIRLHARFTLVPVAQIDRREAQ